MVMSNKDCSTETVIAMSNSVGLISMNDFVISLGNRSLLKEYNIFWKGMCWLAGLLIVCVLGCYTWRQVLAKKVGSCIKRVQET